MKLQAKKGFTLIEIMIVVAIIWILAVTILPSLQWWQARARDAWRKASLNSISAVLETFFSDNWVYPSATNTNCISDDTWGNTTAWSGFVWMFKSSVIPINPQKSAKSWWCGTAWAYGYNKIKKDGIDGAWYMLFADVEQFQNANVCLNTACTASVIATTAPATSDEYDTWVVWSTKIKWWKLTTEAWWGAVSQYWTTN